MDTREALIYGEEVKNHLSEARQFLTDKYHATLEEPVVVEIFPRQKEFAVRLWAARWRRLPGSLFRAAHNRQFTRGIEDRSQLEGHVVA